MTSPRVFAFDRSFGTLDHGLGSQDRQKALYRIRTLRSREDSKILKGHRVVRIIASATSISFILDPCTLLQIYLRGMIVDWRIAEEALPEIEPLCLPPPVFFTDYPPPQELILWDGQRLLDDILHQRLLGIFPGLNFVDVDFEDHPPLSFWQHNLIETRETLLHYFVGEDEKLIIREIKRREAQKSRPSL